MPTVKLTLPEPSVPLIDPQTGKITEAWYIKLQQLVTLLNSIP